MSALISLVDDLMVVSVGSRVIVIRDLGTSATNNELCIQQTGAAGADQAGTGSAEAGETSVELTSIHVSSCQSYILATTSDKRLIVWARRQADSERHGEKWVLHSTRKTPRKCIQSSLTGQIPTMVLVADRAGDVYEYPLEDCRAAPQLLMGRLSMLLDMALTSSNDFLIVCDRDEKIQVSSYPECYNIVAFCLGHQQFVTSISTLDQFEDRLVSVGGDGQLKLWNFRTGKCLASFDCWADASQVERLQPFEQYCGSKDGEKIRPPLKKVMSCGTLVVVIYSRVPYVHILQCGDGETFKNLGGVLTELPVWDATIDQSSRLWILTPLLTVYKLDTLGMHSKDQPAPEIAECFEDLLGPVKDVPEKEGDLLILYKQWFDNVEEYLQRKKTRQEEKQLKKRKVRENKLGVL